SQHLEEGKLGLDADDVRCDRVDHPATEAAARLGLLFAPQRGIAAQLDRKELRSRIESSDELAALALDCLGEPVGEERGRERGCCFHQAEAYRAPGTAYARSRAPEWGLVAAASAVASALDRGLEGTAGLELGHGRSGDVHLLGRVPRVHAHARRAMRRRELAEPGERDLVAAN